MPDIDTALDDQHRMDRSRRQLHCLQLAALAKCRLPSARDQAFVTDVGSSAVHNIPLTDRQETHLLRLCWRYRRQMPRHLVPDLSPDDPLSPHFQGWRPTVAPVVPPSERGTGGVS